MAKLMLYLFDDAAARAWQPFALTRPAGELMLGAFTGRARAERCFGSACAGHIAAPHLAGFAEPGAAPVVEPTAIPTDRDRLFLNARFIPDWNAGFQPPTRPAAITADDTVVGWFAPAGYDTPDNGWFLEPTAGDDVATISGRVLHNVWELVAENPDQLRRDFDGVARSGAVPSPPRDFATVGYRDGQLRLGSGVTIEPGVVFDFADGPIWLDDNVTVRAFTRLAGPAYVGPGSTLLGGPYTAVSVGPVCKLHGEVEETVVLGYSNKAHDGFLGHAYLGRWVNLGAMTTNSDLKNNYGPVRMWTPAGEADTGLIKLGCLLGDYVKTGIGSLLNTGTVVGAGSNLFGSAMPPKYVPPFSWGTGTELVEFRADKFLELTATVMRRRSLELADGMRGMLERAHALGRGQASGAGPGVMDGGAG
ncbi:MAG TPA: putative sugar nucleotidyl transferase [Longimicrobiales bacterium]|nr:putative sugar nucleotidyl transferase [Longimicrobiales bacterium]